MENISRSKGSNTGFFHKIVELNLTSETWKSIFKYLLAIALEFTIIAIAMCFLLLKKNYICFFQEIETTIEIRERRTTRE